ncbi:mucoidy inhibitor MuiA family protein [Entomomonas asaccharolytica]|uniref:Mucoidy inhibitor MuiA family protein n=1 Tax=Entomomonas asaccharolytica TaxID=2785331 RepID=A0A974NFG4_9GAMM|nr:mucoidy inhibitor MuiA family protein [Entomomonas asaccharolytica]QQP85796.1 mucoidy inhibitor MuiA family protein [Entomomonas asaccharolytica]
MKQWLSVICLGTLSIYCYAEQKTLTSAIKEVTVYTDRAAITRKAEILLPAGEHELSFNNLPVQLDNNSVQLNALSTVPTTILDVTTKQQARLEEANIRLQKIDQEIKQLNAQLNALADQEKLLINQQEFVKKMQEGVLAPSKDATRPSAQELQNIMQFAKDNLATILEKQRTIVKQTTALKKQLSVLQNERYPIQQKTGYQVKNVVVRVNLQQAGKVNLDLTYMIYGANWYPSYDARFDSRNNKLSVTYLGVISQRTGEDWQNVKLTLSTAKPNLGGNAPELTAWLINEATKVKPITPKLAGASGYASMAPAPMAAMQEEVAVRQIASVDTGMTSASFNIAKPTSLASDGSQQKVTITDIDLASKLQYITVPKLAQAAYLQAASINNTDFPLLAGKLNIFMDNRFITTGSLKTIMPKQELKLDLGVDEGIAITYKQLNRFTEKTGLTSCYNKVTYEYLLTVQNNKQTPETIKIMDHIPVSQDEKITVKLLSPNPKTIEQDKQGKITWQQTLSAGEKKETMIKFSVEYPVDMNIRGL